MSEFSISTTWLEHSTKFYQLIQIERTANAGVKVMGRLGSVTVAHYGGLNVLPANGDRRPISSGQGIVYPAADAFETKLAEKTRKGYRATGGQPTFRQSEPEFRKWLQQNLQTKHRDKVLLSLGMALDPNAQPIDPNDEPTPVPETVTRAPEETPEGWGDW